MTKPTEHAPLLVTADRIRFAMWDIDVDHATPVRKLTIYRCRQFPRLTMEHRRAGAENHNTWFVDGIRVTGAYVGAAKLLNAPHDFRGAPARLAKLLALVFPDVRVTAALGDHGMIQVRGLSLDRCIALRDVRPALRGADRGLDRCAGDGGSSWIVMTIC